MVIAESEEEMLESWLKWHRSTKNDGLKINTTKTRFKVKSREKVTAKVVDCNNVELEQVHNIKYLGVTLSENGGLEETVRERKNAAWLKWKERTNMIYDKPMSRNVK